MYNLQTLSTISPLLVHVLDVNVVFPNVIKLGLYTKISGSNMVRFPNIKCVQSLKIIRSSFNSIRLNAVSLSLTKITLRDTMLASDIFESLGQLQTFWFLR